MRKVSYILLTLIFLCSCGENKKSEEMQNSEAKFPNCDSETLRTLNDSNTALEEYATLINSTHDNCWIAPEVWEAIIKDSSFTLEHRVNALYGLILNRFQSGMTLHSFLQLIDSKGIYGVKGNFRLCRNPLFFENRKQGDVFVMCNPLGNVCSLDSSNVENCYSFTIQISSRSSQWSSHINEDNPAVHQKIRVDAIYLSGRDWDLMIGKN